MNNVTKIQELIARRDAGDDCQAEIDVLFAAFEAETTFAPHPDHVAHAAFVARTA